MGAHKTVLVFGVFDGLHEGHRHFFTEAKKLGDKLVAIVAPDKVVATLKNHAPRFPLAERIKAIEESGLADEICAGDETPRTWSGIRKYSPDIVALGYDQMGFASALEEFIQKEHLPISLVRLPSYKPETFHSSLIKNQAP